jgi:hypothetical protein
MKHILAGVSLICSVVLLQAGISFAGGGEAVGTVVEKGEAHQCTKPKCIICANAMSDSYLNKAGGRLIRGLSNAALAAPVELGRATVKTGQERAGGWQIFDNLGWGTLDFFTRTCGGIVDVMTFWEPQIHNDKMSPDCAFGRSEIVDR